MKFINKDSTDVKFPYNDAKTKVVLILKKTFGKKYSTVFLARLPIL
jgi:hypothetical protein